MKKGAYKSDKKTGEWNYYYSNGDILAKVNFNKGYPAAPIQLFNKDGSIKAKIIPLGNDLLYDCRPDSIGNFNVCDTTSSKDYRIIFD